MENKNHNHKSRFEYRDERVRFSNFGRDSSNRNDERSFSHYDYQNQGIPYGYREGYDRFYGQSASDSTGWNQPSYDKNHTPSSSHYSNSDNANSWFMGTDSAWASSTTQSSNQMSHAGKGPKGWQRSDESICERVCDQLEKDSELNASEIEVKVTDGIVNLTGKVDTRASKRRAEDIIENIPGVKDIHNELNVDKSFFQNIKDNFVEGFLSATSSEKEVSSTSKKSDS